MQPILILPLVLVVVGLTFSTWLVMTPEGVPGLLSRRLERFTGPDFDAPLLPEEEGLGRPFFERAIQPVLSRLERLAMRYTTAGQIDSLGKKLVAAGGLLGLSAPGFLALQLAAALAGGTLGLLVSLAVGASGVELLVLPIAALGVGYMVPTFKLGGKVKERSAQILEGLPNALDLLTISVEAGLGLDAALMRVGEKYHNALADELTQVLNEMKLGRARRDALLSMGERCQIEELTTFIQAVVQSEQMGTSLGTTLRIQSEEMRRKRRQHAEELGAKAPLKMLLPMVGCIFPTIFIVLLGPAALQIMTQVSK